MNLLRAIASLCVVALLLCASQRVRAAEIPTAVGYQGYLTDNAGVPVNATLDLTFRLYTGAIGGEALWQEEQLGVVVAGGQLTVALGSNEELTPELFANADTLWLSLQVAGDSEMAPRVPWLSVPFSLFAGDANTLQGRTADDLDELPELMTHAADLTVHKSTAAVRADIDSDLNHGTNASHNYYTDARAVAAMGAKADANPLNHDRFVPPAPQEVSSTTDTTTTSTSFGTMEDMTLSPGPGSYLVLFSTSVENSSAATTYVAIFVGGTEVTASERRFFNEGSIPSTPVPLATQAVIDVQSGQSVEVSWRASGGTSTAHERTLTLIGL